ncbi:thioredoxin-like protein [Mycena rebaudengoi]|nr:thioredoxin-like protein [Mycena rebaudengoi]
MIVVYHLNNSRSQRILWLLEELGVPYEVKVYRRNSSGRAPKTLFEVAPLGRFPVITDGDVVLAESGAIIEYLISKYATDGKFKAPSSGKEYTNNLYFTHYAEGSIMPLLVQRLIFTTSARFMPTELRQAAIPIFAQVQKERIDPEIKTHAAFLESHLEKVEWFAGGSGPTAADFAMSFALEGLALLKMAGPKCRAYVAKIQARPAYLRAIERGESRYAYKL